jgi:hypothetical protein
MCAAGKGNDETAAKSESDRQPDYSRILTNNTRSVGSTAFTARRVRGRWGRSAFEILLPDARVANCDADLWRGVGTIQIGDDNFFNVTHATFEKSGQHCCNSLLTTASFLRQMFSSLIFIRPRLISFVSDGFGAPQLTFTIKTN